VIRMRNIHSCKKKECYANEYEFSVRHRLRAKPSAVCPVKLPHSPFLRG
jgi:hypothetical protein